jgi:hypothetical protein
MENQNNQIVKYQSITPILARQEKLITIENKILTFSKQRIILNLTLEHSDLFIKFFSQYYPMSEYLMEKYRYKWDWGELSHNSMLPWSIELIEKFKEKWKWKGSDDPDDNGGLSQNPNLPWSVKLIEKFVGRWDWGHVWLPSNYIRNFRAARIY